MTPFLNQSLENASTKASFPGSRNVHYETSLLNSIIHGRHRLLSSLAGHSPMAPSSVNPLPQHTSKRIPTAEEVSMAGGVWAPTSAKRDKIAELKIALQEGQNSLDDAASKDELLDLYLADGIKLISKVTDLVECSGEKELPVIQEFTSWLKEQEQSDSATMDKNVKQTELESKLQIISAKLSTLLERIPSDRCFRHVRDFLDPDTLNDGDLENVLAKPDNKLDAEKNSFQDAVTRFRLLLTKAAVDHIQKSWNVLTKVSDSDIDRAAVKGIALTSQVDTVSLSKVYGFLEAHASGTCSGRVTAAWHLLDRDNDGLLNEDEMNQVAFLCLQVEQEALPKFFEQVLEAYPTRAPLPAMDSDNQSIPIPNGWRQRRAETKIRKRLLKMFKLSCKNTFRDEVEINHRLRCIYAWAEKADQDNKIESVLVDADGWSGRKRYVELSPKISEAEFREVQRIHFKHLDQIGTEIIKSFREDLWVSQGKGRERKELVRDCLLFLTVVSALDFVILSL
ncbi:hypothetical protein IV203_038519 [Nitzschia inconspicua]|uniref:EF-hand domain-containing protein n=1 Tax=Nitzschia inconspicua TaxID=303405 RepID=A0A9K3LQZ1_9STRA|nr:hypothetical protein IV203_038519 [Nitzschia inconspicua]